MQKRLTINIDEKIYSMLYKSVGRQNVSPFIESLLLRYVADQELESAYKQMAKDEKREAEALEWSEALIGDVSDETR